MGALVKIVKCLRCEKEMEIKTLRLNPGKYVFGKGYICEECLKKEKEQKTPKKGR